MSVLWGSRERDSSISIDLKLFRERERERRFLDCGEGGNWFSPPSFTSLQVGLASLAEDPKVFPLPSQGDSVQVRTVPAGDGCVHTQRPLG